MSLDALGLLESISLKRADLRYCERLDQHSRRWNAGEHSHPYFEFLLFLEAPATVSAGGRSFEVAPFDLVLYPPHLPHTEHLDPSRPQAVTCLWADLGPCPRFPGAIRVPDAHGAIGEIFRSIQGEYVRNRRFAKEVIACHLRTLVWLLRQHFAEPATESRTQVERCLSFIHENYAQDFPVEALAETVLVSPSYLFRIFRRRVGVTPVHYRNLVRVDKAKHLLLDERLKLEEIAGRVGFEDVRYFARVFKKETGASPSEFRKRSVAQ